MTHSGAAAAFEEAEQVTGEKRRLGPLSWVARNKKLDYFLPMLPKSARILDLGCADNWFTSAAAARGWNNIVGIDLVPPADIVGDVNKWADLGLEAHSFDAIIAFEVIEHGDVARPMHDLLKSDGLLMATTPVPRWDPVCRLFETVGLLQKRTSPHTHLIDLRNLPHFTVVERSIKAVISQWAVLRPE